METIYKYPIKVTDLQEVYMPTGAEVLAVQCVNGVPYIWAKVNPKNEILACRFRLFGTGHPIEDNFKGKYINTFQMERQNLVFHLFQL